MSTMVRIAAAVLLTLALGGVVSSNSAQAQQSFCLNLPPDTYELVVPSRERDGTVTFKVEIGEGGEIVEFYEPGGQPVGAAAGIGLFVGGGYELPEGILVVDCPYDADAALSQPQDGDDSMSDDSMEDGEEQSAAPAQTAAQAAPGLCVNLSEGSHTFNVTAFGQATSVTAQIGPGGSVIMVDAGSLGVHPGAAVAGMIGSSIILPPDVQVVECAVGLPNSGTGGLLDGGLSAQQVGLVTVAALGVSTLSLLTLLARRRSRALR